MGEREAGTQHVHEVSSHAQHMCIILWYVRIILKQTMQILMGITSNTPARTMETVLPMNGYHRFFR